MKFIYVDESGFHGESDEFVMCGLMVDAYKLRKKTHDFDQMLTTFHAKHSLAGAEIKASQLINGSGKWRHIDADERKEFFTEICKLAIENGGKVFGIAFSREGFESAQSAGNNHPFDKNYWLAASMFTCALVQKKMQSVKGNKGLTVVIMDDNQKEMPSLSNGLYQANSWYDGLYKERKKKYTKNIWLPRNDSDRFDQIINTAFAIKSNHSSLVQVADVICFVYRRHLELMSKNEKWAGETEFYTNLVNVLDSEREKLGHSPDDPCVKFYKTATHSGWAL